MKLKLIKIFLASLVGVLMMVLVGVVRAESPWPMFQHDAQHTGRSRYVGPQTSNLKWVLDNPSSRGNIYGNVIVASDNTLYFYASLKSINGIIALNPDGSEKWIFKEKPISSPLVLGANGSIYAFSGNNLIAISPAGVLEWEKSFDAVYSPPIVDSEGKLYFISRYTEGDLSRLCLIRAESQEEFSCVYEFEQGNPGSSLSIDSNGAFYFILDNSLYALNPDGTEKWSIELSIEGDSAESSLRIQPFSISSQGIIYVPVQYNGWHPRVTKSRLFAIDAETSNILWTRNFSGSIDDFPAIGPEQTVYFFNSYDSRYAWWHLHFYALNGFSGENQWYKNIQNQQYSGCDPHSLPIVDSAGNVYFSFGSSILAFNSEGDEILKISVPLSDLTLANGTLYASGRHGLYAFGSTVQSTCSDGIKNGDETDIDCGGSCSACENGKTCAVNNDCQSGFCDAGVCNSPPEDPLSNLTCSINPINNHLYCLTPEGSNFNWLEAENYAVGLGGHLVAINNQEEQDWLVQTFGDNKWMWIGFTDSAEEGTWIWANGDPATYTKWEPTEPEPNDMWSCGEDYAIMNWICPGCWNDLGECSPEWNSVGIGIIEFPGEIPSTNQYYVNAHSVYFPSGDYSVELMVNDPNQTIQSVSVTGPGIDGSISLEQEIHPFYPCQWWSKPNVDFSSNPPDLPLVYTFTITDKAGAIYEINDSVQSYVDRFATNLLPEGNQTDISSLVFSWSGVDIETVKYKVELYDEGWNRKWDSSLVTNTSIAYNGPALASGDYQYFVAVFDKYGNSSLAYQTFQIGNPPENQPPDPPDKNSLWQLKSDGTTQIGIGATTDENTVIFKSKVSDPDGDKVKLQIELRRLKEYNREFDETKGGFKESKFVESGSEAVAYANELINADYHWRARTVDEHGFPSKWVEFGDNDISDTDFKVSAPLPVPYYSQGYTQWCVPTSMAMILKYYGINIHSWDIAKYWGWNREGKKYTWGQDDKIREYFDKVNNDYNLSGNRKLITEERKDITFNTIKGWINRNMPILLSIDGCGLRHMVVIVGYSDADGIQKVYIHDPSDAFLKGRSPFPIRVPVEWRNVKKCLGWRSYAIAVKGEPNPPKGTLNIDYSDKGFQFEGNNFKVYSRLDNGLEWEPDLFTLNKNNTFIYRKEIANHTESKQRYGLEIKFLGKNGYSPPPHRVLLDKVNFNPRSSLPSGMDLISLQSLLGENYGEYTITLTLYNSDFTEEYDKIVFPSVEYKSDLPLPEWEEIIEEEIESGYIEIINLNKKEREELYRIVSSVFKAEEIRKRGSDELFNELDFLLKRIHPDHPDYKDKKLEVKDFIKEGTLSEGEELFMKFVGGLTSIVVSLKEGGIAVDPSVSFVTEEITKTTRAELLKLKIVRDIGSFTIEYPGSGKMTIFYNRLENKLLVTADLEGSIEEHIFMIIPLKTKPLRNSWNEFYSHGICTGILCTYGEALQLEISTPKTEDIKIVGLESPGELRVYDSQGRVTGLVNGEAKEEIPNSMYDAESKTVIIFDPFDNYRYEVAGIEDPDEDTYGLTITSVENGEVTTFTATDIPITPGEVHQYTIDWDVLSQDGEGATLKIDLDGDGDFDKTHTTGNTLDMGEPKLETQIAITEMVYGEVDTGIDILDEVTQDVGDKKPPLLLSELEESAIDLEDYTSDGKINPGKKKKLKMRFKFLETAGNEYQGKSINVKFKFKATQEEQ